MEGAGPVGEEGQVQSGQEPTTEEQLMAQLAAGRQEALRLLHGRLAPMVYHLARRHLDPPAAEEVTQDVFLRIWQKAARFDPAAGTCRAWVMQIARRRVLHELRERSRRPRFDRGSEAALTGLAAHEGGPHEQLWAEFRRTTVRRAIAALPREQGRALRLAFFQELSHEEVARFLALPLGTAKGRIRLALAKLNAPLAGLVAALIATLGLGGWSLARHRARLGRDDRALGMLTGSHMEALRLEPLVPAGPVEAGPHATYRAERGGTVVVLTLSHVPVAPAGRSYRLWRRQGGTWQMLAEPVPDAQGRARMVLEAPAQPWPEALRLTLEDRSPAHGPGPAGAPVLAWPQAR